MPWRRCGVREGATSRLLRSGADPSGEQAAASERGLGFGSVVGALAVPLLLFGSPLLLAQPLPAQLVTGQVLERGVGDPVASATVQLLDADGEAVSVIVTDGSGRFVLQAPEPGSYRVRASKSGFTAAASAEFHVEAGAVSTVETLYLAVDEETFEAAQRARTDAASGAVVGQVLEEGFGEPIEAVVVTLVRAEEAAAPDAVEEAGVPGPEGRGLAYVISDERGRFRLPVPEPGTYRVHASRIGYEGVISEDVRVIAGGEATELTIELPYAAARAEVGEEGSRVERGRRQFQRRSAAGHGFHFTREDIAAMDDVDLPSEVFYYVPGLNVAYHFDDPARGEQARIVSTQGWGCMIVMFNHSSEILSLSADSSGDRVEGGGNLMRAGTPFGRAEYLEGLGRESEDWRIDDFPLDEIEGIEVYRSYREVPDELKEGLRGYMLWPRDQLGGCGFALIWTSSAW